MESPEISRFLKLARVLQSIRYPAGWSPGELNGDPNMTTTDIRTRLFAAVFALGVSAVFMATAIVPASPNGLVIA